jgi:hypothetical protein
MIIHDIYGYIIYFPSASLLEEEEKKRHIKHSESPKYKPLDEL